MKVQIAENINLWTIQSDAYAHGCNMKGLMGHGIAVQFRQRYPQMYKSYKSFCDDKQATLGSFFFWPRVADQAPVYNLFTQVRPGKDGRLEACYAAFCAMFNHAQQNDISTIAMPAIGCGIAGLRWKDVKFNLEQAVEKSDFNGEVIVAFLSNEFL